MIRNHCLLRIRTFIIGPPPDRWNLSFIACAAQVRYYSRSDEHEHTKHWSASVKQANAFVFVTPEYNHSAPPALVNALDFLDVEWAYKLVAFVTYRLARESNEYGTRLKSEHLGRFGFLAVLQIFDPQGAPQEIAYAMDKFGADGIALITNYGDKWLGDPQLFPIMEEINRKKLVVYTQPRRPTAAAIFRKTCRASWWVRSGPTSQVVAAHYMGHVVAHCVKARDGWGIETNHLGMFIDVRPGECSRLAHVHSPHVKRGLLPSAHRSLSRP